MKKFFLVLTVFLFVAVSVQAEDGIPADLIGEEIAHSISELRCADLSTFPQIDLEYYFKKVFSTKESGRLWVDKIYRHAKSHDNLLALKVYIEDPAFSLTGDPFVQFALDDLGIVYTFRQSSRMACNMPSGKMSYKNCKISNGHFGTFGPAK